MFSGLPDVGDTQPASSAASGLEPKTEFVKVWSKLQTLYYERIEHVNNIAPSFAEDAGEVIADKFARSLRLSDGHGSASLVAQPNAQAFLRATVLESFKTFLGSLPGRAPEFGNLSHHKKLRAWIGSFVASEIAESESLDMPKAMSWMAETCFFGECCYYCSYYSILRPTATTSTTSTTTTTSTTITTTTTITTSMYYYLYYYYIY